MSLANDRHCAFDVSLMSLVPQPSPPVEGLKAQHHSVFAPRSGPGAGVGVGIGDGLLRVSGLGPELSINGWGPALRFSMLQLPLMANPAGH